MKGHAIFVNNSIIFVVIGDEEIANKKMNELKEEHLKKKFQKIDINDYNEKYNWHIRIVDSLIMNEKKILC